MTEYTLMSPLFVNGNFNREYKRMRAVLVVEIPYEKNGKRETYRLFRKDGKPDHFCSQDPDDQYWLFLETKCFMVDDYKDVNFLVPIGYTWRGLINAAGREPAIEEVYGGEKACYEFVNHSTPEEREVKRVALMEAVERYGRDPSQQVEVINLVRKEHIERYQMALDAAMDGDHNHAPDFIGAALMNDLDCCLTISKEYKEWREAEEKEGKANRDRIRENAIADAEKVFLYGGSFANLLYWDYDKKGAGTQEYLLVLLLRKYSFKVTKGMAEKLSAISMLAVELDIKTAVKKNRAPRMKAVSIHKRDGVNGIQFRKATKPFRGKWWELRDKILEQN